MVSHWLFRHPLSAAGVQEVFKTFFSSSILGVFSSSILGFVLAAVILIEKIYTIYHTNVRENLLVFAVS